MSEPTIIPLPSAAENAPPPVTVATAQENVMRYSRRIILALRKLMQQTDTYSRHLMKRYDITIGQLTCLCEIYERGAMTLAVLSKRVHLSSSTLVGIIDRLEEKKLVKRSRNTEDRRAVFIDITDKGREFIQTEPHLLHNRLDDSLRTLSEQEQIIIANSLDMLVGLLEERQPR